MTRRRKRPRQMSAALMRHARKLHHPHNVYTCASYRLTALLGERGADDGVSVRTEDSLIASIGGAVALASVLGIAAANGDSEGRLSDFMRFSAPAGNRPASTNTVVDGVRAAVLPNGRLVTPAGVEVNVQAPKPFGMALSPDGDMLATLNSGSRPFSLTLIKAINGGAPTVKRIDV